VQVVGDHPFVDHAGARSVIEVLQNLPDSSHERPASEVLADIVGRPSVTGEIRRGHSPGLQSPKQKLLAKLDSDARNAWDECGLLAENFPGTLREFLDHLLLRQGADRYNRQAEQITLITLHAAKGLEFPVVFVAGCETGILPYARPETAPDVDEERRLLYVGMTRAKQVLYITSARERTLFGKREERQPSPFIREIEERLREDLRTASRKRRPPHKQMAFDF
jgi:superfamily I DNA/RNA helicase